MRLRALSLNEQTKRILCIKYKKLMYRKRRRRENDMGGEGERRERERETDRERAKGIYREIDR